MKPIIKKQSHYNMLLMRDDSAVRSMRVKGSTITAFVVFILLIAVGGAGGIWGGLHFWQKYVALSELHERQERELSEARLQLERYVNYETLLEAANGGGPRAKNEEIGAVSSTRNATQAVPVASAAVSTPGAPAVSTSGGGAEGNAGVESATTAPAAGATPQAVEPPPSPKVPALPLISSSTSPLRVNAFTGRVLNSQRLRVRYELLTAVSEGQKSFSGAAKYFAVFADGKQAELPVPDISDARFSISRMKVMDANIRMPQGINARDITQISVILELDGGTAYQELFPVMR